MSALLLSRAEQADFPVSVLCRVLRVSRAGYYAWPRRRRATPALGLHAVKVLAMRGLLPLAVSVVGLTMPSHRRLPSGRRGRGHPLVYSEASVPLLALLGRLWQLSTREVCLWLGRWPALAAACGLPPGRLIHSPQPGERHGCHGARTALCYRPRPIVFA